MSKASLSMPFLTAGALTVLLLWRAADRPQEKTVVPGSEGTTIGASASTVVPHDKTPPVQSPPETPPPTTGAWAVTLRELDALAARDPKAALVRIGEMGEAEEQQSALKEVCSVIARNDPALALAAAWHFELGKLGGLAELRALETLAKTWAVRDPEAALAWMARESQDKAGLRDYVTKGIAAAVSQDSPEGAALLIAEDMSDNYPRFEAAAALAGERSDKAF